MNRRNFLRAAGTVSAASLARVTIPEGFASAGNPVQEGGGFRDMKTMLFWDLTPLDEMHNLRHNWGRPVYRPEANYTDPHTGSSGGGVVFFHEQSGTWRKIYGGSKKFIAESDDGIAWRPSPQPGAQPEGGQVAPHHVYTGPGGNCSSLYVDPVAADGYPYKMILRQDGKVTSADGKSVVYERAMADPDHRWHELAKKVGEPKIWMIEEMMQVSRDGIRWETRRDYNWGQPHYHPEQPYFLFYNHYTGKHAMTVRPGLGDRRVCLQTTDDFKHWSGPELIIQRDPFDTDLTEFYAMPVCRYGQWYVGLLWTGHFTNALPVHSYNQYEGPMDNQLTYSWDGIHFVRGQREAFIPLNPPGEFGCGGLLPESIVEVDDEIRIYSGSSKKIHGVPFPESMGSNQAGLMHSLRKDGFRYFSSQGEWATFTTKPLAILGEHMELNAEATLGDIRIQITDCRWSASSDRHKPIEGYTFEDFIPIRNADSVRFPLRWKNRRNLGELVNTCVRFNVQFRNARIYSFRGKYHFVDAQDERLTRDGMPIDTALFNM
jgi:hypothetical protein